MEKAATSGNTRKLYQLIRQTTGKFAPVSEVIQDRHGENATSYTDRMNRWKEYFSEILNGDESDAEEPCQLYQPTTAEPPTVYRETVNPPSAAEIANAIKCLKNNKASGEDGLAAEIYKCSSPMLKRRLQKLIARVCGDEKNTTRLERCHPGSALQEG